MFKRVLLGVSAVAVGGIFLVVGASPASAKINGPCEGSGQFDKGGFTVSAAETGVVTVPEKDTVNWEGSITPTDAGEQPYAGEITIELPPPFPAVKVDDWDGTTDATGNSDSKDYDIPSFVPRGVEFDVKGFHNQGSAHCDGSVTVKIDGSNVGPISVASLALSAVALAGMIFAGRAKG